MLKVLARGIAALTVLAALAAAGPAVGGDRAYSANFENGGTISFELNQGNRPRVHDISIKGITATCEEGRNGYFIFDIYGWTPVLADRSFAVRSESEDGKAKAVVRGKFSRSFKRAEGTARVHGKLQDPELGWVRCDSDKQKFVAKLSG